MARMLTLLRNGAFKMSFRLLCSGSMHRYKQFFQSKLLVQPGMYRFERNYSCLGAGWSDWLLVAESPW